MRILLWHVHGSWTTAFVHGAHEYAVPVVPGRGPDGLGLPTTYVWPEEVSELSPAQIGEEDWDLVVLQRPHELALAEEWLGRRLSRDIPAVYVEHNAPQGRVNEMRHPCAERPEIGVVHVTHFNRLFWDCGAAPTQVIEHGIVDPGHRYSGELRRVAVVINEPGRRARVTGTDLVPVLADGAPVDLFGMGAWELPHDALHDEMARRRVYLHPIRWTSLGLSLLEAMQLGMPVVALATTEVPRAVPPEAGIVSADLDELRAGVRALLDEPARAREMGAAARAAALSRYSLERFHSDWDALLRDRVGVLA